jgi:hypothetical protein
MERRRCVLRSATLLSGLRVQGSPRECHPDWNEPLFTGLGRSFRCHRGRCGWSTALAKQVKAHRKGVERRRCILRGATLLSGFLVQSSPCERHSDWSKPLLAGFDGRLRGRRKRCRCGFLLFRCCSGFWLRLIALAACEYQGSRNNND